MRKGLFMFRQSMLLSQKEMAARIGCNRATYSAIETGKRDGRITFWRNLQTAFNVSDAELGGLMRIDKDKTKNDRAID